MSDVKQIVVKSRIQTLKRRPETLGISRNQMGSKTRTLARSDVVFKILCLNSPCSLIPWLTSNTISKKMPPAVGKKSQQGCAQGVLLIIQDHLRSSNESISGFARSEKGTSMIRIRQVSFTEQSYPESTSVRVIKVPTSRIHEWCPPNEKRSLAPRCGPDSDQKNLFLYWR